MTKGGACMKQTQTKQQKKTQYILKKNKRTKTTIYQKKQTNNNISWAEIIFTQSSYINENK